MENLLPQNVGSIINYMKYFTGVAQWELQVAVDHNQLWTMASEIIDPIDWLHPLPHGQYPLSPSCILEIGAVSVQPGIDLATSACKATTLPMRPLRV